MAPTILVVGATGNTGRGVVQTLSEHLNTSKAFSGHQILAVTRSLSGAAAQSLAALPNVEVAELKWADITADWLRQHDVVRAFIASHNQPSQFTEESGFYLAALNAGVKYVVRISTTAANVRPDCAAYYARTHWAIEALLSSPEFQSLKWTSLQPNIFSNFYLYPAVEFVKAFQKTGKQGPLALVASEDAPVGIIDPSEVGIFAGRLLLEEDVSAHNKAKYVLNGPEDITGRQIVILAEKEIGAKVEDVHFKDTSFIEHMAAQDQETKSLMLSAVHALETAWDGKGSASTTSKEVLQLGAPKITPADVFKTLLEE
ncbi:hypothetical protein B0T10DRAFT_594274 [Thelonectria olida]|uniref:NmrA-like domain-containing protein n=1 Tax=Thelonectria olida TaxID=1576542 RepID=A0A9P9ASC1_9HYPO|nr:hypothetical protein B0T10DRAFT_594274 [Thelonectria olida]